MTKYNLVQLSDAIAPPYVSFTEPAINERSDVAFEGFVSIELPPFGIFYANEFLENSWSRTIADNSNAFFMEGAFIPVFEPAINDRGTVVFAKTETSILTDENGNPILDENNEPIPQLTRSTVEIGDGEQETTALLDSDTALNLFADPVINNRGTVAYFAGNLLGIPVDFPTSTGIYTVRDGEITEIASTAGGFSSFLPGIDIPGGDGPLAGLDLEVSLNEDDKLAFQATLDVGRRGVFVSDGETITEIANSDGELNQFSSPIINDEEAVAFLAQRDDGSRGIYLNSYGETKLLVDESGAFSTLDSETSLNNNGEVAFYAELDDGGAGIYVASEIGSELVVAIGDELAGSEVVGLGISASGINNRGRVAFQATLENGDIAVFRADPISKPTDGNDRLYGDSGNNYIDGDAGDDLIVGNGGKDTLFGDAGDDLLRGGEGHDTLDGGKGNDTLDGGKGADVFKLASGEGEDLILDYTDGIDKFSLGSGLEFGDLDILQADSNTKIKLSSTGNVLASLYEVDASAIEAMDFV